MPYAGIVANSVDDSVGEILIYGNITDVKWEDTDVTPKEFKDEMDKLNDKKIINLYINSGGGGVFPGMAIYNILQRTKAETFAYVDGLAASIASVILQGAKNRIISKTSWAMIHNAMTIVWGNAKEMRRTADVLDKIEVGILEAYMGRTGMKKEELQAMMDAETWMTGEEAVAFGFADQLVESKDYLNCLMDDGSALINGQTFDLNKFRAFPKDQIPKKKPENKVTVPNYRDYEAQIALNTNISKF
jgi:ATP-dependent Clp protease protease subunit